MRMYFPNNIDLGQKLQFLFLKHIELRRKSHFVFKTCISYNHCYKLHQGIEVKFGEIINV